MAWRRAVVVTAEWFPGLPAAHAEPVGVDTSVAHPARVYDYWLGGKDNFPADRAAGDAAVEANPDILPGVRANRRFLARAVHHLAGEVGIRQFLDLGTGLPSASNTHEVAQAKASDTRIVYVDNDPIVLAHARALLTSTEEGATDYIDADIRDTEVILREAARTLDFSKPVAIMTLMVLQYIPDTDDPHGIVARLLAAVPSGSYLVLSDTASDINPSATAVSAARLNQRLGPAKQTRRTRSEIERYFTGLDLIEPGLVPLNRWRPEPDDPRFPRDVPTYCGVGRKS